MKISISVNIEESIRQEFKSECSLNCQVMSTVIESMMIEYIKISKEIREQNLIKQEENGRI